MKKYLSKILVVSLLAALIFSMNLGIPSVQAASSNLTLDSSNSTLVSLFNWAKGEALSYVVTSGGIPCYWASYPTRQNFCSRDFCHQVIGAHMLGLDSQNYNMMLKFAESATSARVYFPCWSLDFNGNPSTIDYKSDTDFVRELPSVGNLVAQAWALYQWTGDSNYINNSDLLTYYNNACTIFVTDHDANKNGITDQNNGDNIWAGISSYYETGGYAPTESGDGIATQYAGYVAYANILTQKGETSTASTYSSKASALKTTFNNDWLDNTNDRYLEGYTNWTTPYTGWGESQTFFPLMYYIANPGTRANNNMSFAQSNEVAYDNAHKGIETRCYMVNTTYAWEENQTGYNWLIDVMSDTNQYPNQSWINRNYPEVSYTAIGNIATGMMGIQAAAYQNWMATRPRLTNNTSWVSLNNIPIGSHNIYVKEAFDGSNYTVTVTHNSGSAAITWQSQFVGSYATLYVNGSAQTPSIWTDGNNGHTISSVNVTLNAGQTATVSTTNSPGSSVTVYASNGTLSGAATKVAASFCASGYKVGDLGDAAANYVTLTANVPTAGTYTMTVYAIVSGTRTYDTSVNGGSGPTISVTGTTWSALAPTVTANVTLNAGNNTIKFYNNSAWCPDLDEIVLTPQ